MLVTVYLEQNNNKKPLDNRLWLLTVFFCLKNFSRCIIKKNKKVLHAIAVIASVMSVLMYVSYIPQIYGNLHGEKGNPTQPLVAMINCIFWTIHGLYGDDGETRDKSIIFANVPGIIFGFFAFITAL